MQSYQHTLRRRAALSGVGLHSGIAATISIFPGEIGGGILFRRTDLKMAQSGVAAEAAADRCEIRAAWDSIVGSHRGTTLANAYGVSVATVEHLMAALAGCGVDNAVVEVDGPEIPILDGSAAPFVEAIEEAGVNPQTALRRYLQIAKPVSIRDGERWIKGEPAPLFQMAISVEFQDAAIGAQSYCWPETGKSFRNELSLARTFCSARDIDALRAAGLARGGSLQNAVVVDGGRVLNDDGLRYHDEFARHKALDLLGDLYVGGAPIIGRIEAHRPGHDLNRRFLQALFETDGAVVRATSQQSSENGSELLRETA